MAIAYRGGNNSGGAANPTGTNVQMWQLTGTNAVAGDLAICVFYSRASTKTLTSITGPTAITGYPASTANGGMIWAGYKVINATDITNGYCGVGTLSSVTNGTSGWFTAVFSGVDTSLIRRAAPVAGGSDTAPNPPAIAAAIGECLVIFYGSMQETDTPTAPANFTLGTNAGWSTISGTDGSSYLAYDLVSDAGGTVDPDAFTTQDAAYWYAGTIILLPEDYPTITNLNTPADAGTVTTGTPEFKFTGTDGDSDDLEYQIQIDTVNTFEVGVNFWNETSNVSRYIYGNTGTYEAAGQSFLCGKTGYITAIMMYCSQNLYPTDNLILSLHSGSIDGTVIASKSVVADTGNTERLFTFDSPVAVSSGTTYYITLERSGSRDTSNYIIATGNGTTPVYENGDLYYRDSGVWSSNGTSLFFSVYHSVPIDQSSDVETIAFTRSGDTHPFTSGQEVTYQTTETLLDIDATDDLYAAIWGGTGTYEAEGQSFLTGESTSVVVGVVFRARKAVTPTDNITVSLRSGSCSGTVLASGTFDSSSLTGSSLPTFCKFSSSTNLSANTTYYVTWERAGSRDTTNYVELETSINSVYANGQAYDRNNSAWTGQTYDIALTVVSLVPLASDTYYWHVRTKDPLGSNTWSAWSATRSFTVSLGTTFLPRVILI